MTLELVDASHVDPGEITTTLATQTGQPKKQSPWKDVEIVTKDGDSKTYSQKLAGSTTPTKQAPPTPQLAPKKVQIKKAAKPKGIALNEIRQAKKSQIRAWSAGKLYQAIKTLNENGFLTNAQLRQSKDSYSKHAEAVYETRDLWARYNASDKSVLGHKCTREECTLCNLKTDLLKLKKQAEKGLTYQASCQSKLAETVLNTHITSTEAVKKGDLDSTWANLKGYKPVQVRGTIVLQRYGMSTNDIKRANAAANQYIKDGSAPIGTPNQIFIGGQPLKLGPVRDAPIKKTNRHITKKQPSKVAVPMPAKEKEEKAAPVRSELTEAARKELHAKAVKAAQEKKAAKQGQIKIERDAFVPLPTAVSNLQTHRYTARHHNVDKPAIFKGPVTYGFTALHLMPSAKAQMYPDILQFGTEVKTLAAVTGLCYVGKPRRYGGIEVKVDGTIIMIPTSRNRILDHICVPSFTSDNLNIPSGTPIYNSRGMLCSVITQSDNNGTYAVSTDKRYRTGSKTPYCTVEHGGYTEVQEEGIGTFIAKGPKVAGKWQAIPMHCVPLTQRPQYKTGHHYIDYFSTDLMAKVTKEVHVGSPTGRLAVVLHDKMLAYGYDYKQLHMGVLPYINSSEVLMSGTPIYNTDGDVCSAITSSVGNRYVLTSFGDNDTITVHGASIEEKTRTKTIVYGSYEFDNKLDLLEYMKNPKSDGKKITIWRGTPNSINVSVNGSEVYRKRHTGIIVTTFNSQNTKKMINATIETSRIKAEIDSLTTKMSALSAVATAASNSTNSVMRTGGIVQTRRKNRKRPPTKGKGIIKKVTDAVTNTLAIMIAMMYIISTCSAVPTQVQPPQLYCKNMSCQAHSDFSVKPEWVVCSKDKPITVNETIAAAYCNNKTAQTEVLDYIRAYKCDVALDLGPTDLNSANFYDAKNVLYSQYLKLCSSLQLLSGGLRYTNTSCCSGSVDLTSITTANKKMVEEEVRMFPSPIKSEDYDKINAIIVCMEESEEFNLTTCLDKHTNTLPSCERPEHYHNPLIGKNGDDCTQGTELHSGDKSCTRTKPCYNKPARGCLLGAKSLSYGSDTLTTASATGESTCCSLNCFTQAQLLALLEDQPKCTSCFYPLVDSFWRECEVLSPEPRQLQSIEIWSNGTEITEISGNKVWCKNKQLFSACCAGRGPAPTTSQSVYFDGVCACQPPSSKLQVAKNTINSQVHKFYLMLNDWSVTIVVGLVLFICLPTKLFILAAAIYIASINVMAECSVSNLVVTPTSFKNSHVPYKVKLWKGNCIDLGSKTIQLESVKLTSKYAFKYQVPMDVKNTCADFDWGCKGGTGEGIFNVTPCIKCNGLYIKMTDFETSFPSSGCFIGGQIATRIDTCFNLEDSKGLVYVYTRLESRPQINVVVNEYTANNTVLSVESTDFFDLTVGEDYWPQLVAVLPGNTLCSYVPIDFSQVCKYPQKKTNASWAPECIDIRKRWNTKNHKYEVQFTNAGFNNQLANYFQACTLKTSVIEDEYLQVEQIIESLSASVNMVSLSVNVSKCAEKPSYSIRKGVAGWHKSTVIDFARSPTNCSIEIHVDECQSVNGKYHVLNSQYNTTKTLWCASSSKGELEIKGVQTWTFNVDIVKNYVPATNNLWQGIDRLTQTFKSVSSISGFLDTITDVDFSYFPKFFDGLMDRGMFKLAACAMSLYVAWLSFIAMRWVLTAIMIAVTILIWNVKMAESVSTDEILDITEQAMEASVEALNNLGFKVISIYLLTLSRIRLVNIILEVLRVSSILCLVIIFNTNTIIIIGLVFLIARIYKSYTCGSGCFNDITATWPLLPIANFMASKLYTDRENSSQEELHAYAALVLPRKVIKLTTHRVGSAVGYVSTYINCAHVLGIKPSEGSFDLVIDRTTEYATEVSKYGIVINEDNSHCVSLEPVSLMQEEKFYMIEDKIFVSGSVLYTNGKISGLVIGRIGNNAIVESVHHHNRSRRNLNLSDFVFTVTEDENGVQLLSDALANGRGHYTDWLREIETPDIAIESVFNWFNAVEKMRILNRLEPSHNTIVQYIKMVCECKDLVVDAQAANLFGHETIDKESIELAIKSINFKENCCGTGKAEVPPQYLLITDNPISTAECPVIIHIKTVDEPQLRVDGRNIYIDSQVRTELNDLQIVVTKLVRFGIRLIGIRTPKRDSTLPLTFRLSADTAFGTCIVWYNNYKLSDGAIKTFNEGNRMPETKIIPNVPWLKCWESIVEGIVATGVTLNAIKAWNAVQASDTSHSVINATSINSDCGVVIDLEDEPSFKNKLTFLKIETAVSSGSGFIYDSTFVTSYHVTRGNPVEIKTPKGIFMSTIPSYVDRDKDVVMYGKVITFPKVDAGDVVALLDPIAKRAQMYIVGSSGLKMRGRVSEFKRLKPIKISSKSTYQLSRGSGYNGSSGSPIIDSKGRPVAIYGLMKWHVEEDMPAQLNCMVPNDIKDHDVSSYFKEAAKEVVELSTNGTALPNEASHMLLVAPTGTGKTTMLTIEIAKLLKHPRILLLQPTTTAVRNAYIRIAQLISQEKISKVRVSYLIGNRNMEAVGSHPPIADLARPTTEIKIMTYGKAMVSDIKGYSLYLLDEVHTVNDVNVVAMQLLVSSSQQTNKIVKLTATPVSIRGSHHLMDGRSIATTKYDIDTTHQVMPLTPESRKDANQVCIPKGVIGCVAQGCSLNREALMKGVVVFFVASVRDTESGANWAKKYLGSDSGVSVYSCHSGSKQVSDYGSNAWIFATDVIGQSVTIPGLTTVVDFMYEYKPKVMLTRDSTGVNYVRDVVKQVISEATQKQRKGRVGRTNHGYYICPSLTPSPNAVVDPSIIPALTLRLISLNKSISQLHESLKDTDYGTLVEEMKSMEWLQPSYLSSDIWYQQWCANVLSKSTSTPIKMALEDKLKCLANADCDFVWWYLTPSYPLTNKERAIQQPNKYGKGEDSTQSTAFYNTIAAYYGKVSDDNKYLEITQGRLTSCMEVVTKEDDNFEEIHQTHSEIMDREDPPDSDEETHNVGTTIAGGVAVAVASLVAISAYIEKKATRVVTEYISMEEIEAAMYVRYLTNEDVKQDKKEAFNKLKFVMLRLKEYIYKNYKALATTLGYAEEQHSAFLLNAQSMYLCVWEQALTLMSTTGGVAMWTTGGLGSLYGILVPTLEAAIGPVWASVATSVISAVVFYHLGAGVLGVSLIAGLVGYIIRHIVTESKDNMGGRINKTGAGLVTRSLAGSGLGALIALTFQSHIAQTTANATATSAAGFLHIGAMSSTSQAYQIYCLFIHGEGTNAQFGQLILSLFSTTPTSAAMSMSIVLAALALRLVVKNITRNYAEKVRPSPKDHVNPANDQYEMMMVTFDNLIRDTLAAVTVVTNPMSLLSTIIRVTSLVASGQEFSRNLVANSIRQTAGVNPVIEFVHSIVNLLVSEEQHSATAWLVGVSSMLSIGASGVYLQQNQHAISSNKFVVIIKSFFVELYNKIVAVINWLSGRVAKAARGLGKLMGIGAIDSIKEAVGMNVDSPINCTLMNELPPVIVTNDLVLNYLEEKRTQTGLTAIDCLMLDINVGSSNTAGNMRSEFISEVAKNIETSGVHGKMSLHAQVPLELTKASTKSVCDALKNYFGTLELKNDVLTNTQQTSAGVVVVRAQLAHTMEKTRCAIDVTVGSLLQKRVSLLVSVIARNTGVEISCVGTSVSDNVFSVFSKILSRILDNVELVPYNQRTEALHFGDVLTGKALTVKTSIMSAAIGAIVGHMSNTIENSAQNLDRNTFIKKPESIESDYWLMHWRTLMKQFTEDVNIPMEVDDPGVHLPSGVEIKGFSHTLVAPQGREFTSISYATQDVLVKVQNVQDIDTFCYQVSNFALRCKITCTVGKMGSDSHMIYYVPTTCGCTLHFTVEDDQSGFKRYVSLESGTCQHENTFLERVKFNRQEKEVESRTIPKSEVDGISKYMTQAKKLTYELPVTSMLTWTVNKAKTAMHKVFSNDEPEHNLSWWRLFMIDEQETKPLVVSKDQVPWLERVNRWVLLACCIQNEADEIHYEDADDMVEVQEYYIDGFEKARTKKGLHFNFIATGNVKPPPVSVNPEAVIAKYNRNNRRGNKLNNAQWEGLKSKHRVELPKRQDVLANEYKFRASRGGCKMQQLVEQDREFFEDCECILDPTAGFGGFANYLAYAFKDNKPKSVYISTLMEKKHAVPDMSHVSVKDSNVRIISMLNCKNIGHANIQEEKTLQVIAETIAESHTGVDLVILDAGEFFNTSEKSLKWWTNKNGMDYSKEEAYIQLSTMLNQGGKMLLKFNGYFAGGETVFHNICKRFKHVKVFKPGTSHHYNPEFYVYLRGFDVKRTLNNNSLRYLYQRVGIHVDNAQILGERILSCNGRGWLTEVRRDWYDPTKTGVIYIPVTNLDKRAGFRIRYKTSNGGIVDSDWSMNYGSKLRAVTREIQSRTGKKMLPIAKCRFENLEVVGKYKSSEDTHHRRKATNALISEGTHKVFGLNNDNATYGCTQFTTEFREKAIKKRLDVDPGRLNPIVLKELSDVADQMYTTIGKNALNSMDYMTKEEVLVAINAKGATGKFDNQHNLSAFINAHEDWFELVMQHRVRHYETGTECPSYNTVRFKAESKVKKNVQEGKLIYDHTTTREELQNENDLVPRFIMFGDAMTRIAHYIVLGKVLDLANKEKLYKGTMNGTPVHRQGHVLRAVWDMHQENDKREIPNGYSFVHDTEIEQTVPLGDGKTPVGVAMDYTGLDGTITAEERFIEARFLSSFYKPKHKQTVMNCLKDMCYAVCVNDAGDVWLRPGQRGSGELVTSFGNTFLVQCNTVRAMAKSLGVEPAEVLKQSGTVKVTKKLEVGAVPTFSDGDDTIIITNAENARRISNNIGQYLAEANKSIRSGTKTGVEICRSFESLVFCSHKYTKVKVGVNAICEENGQHRVYYLPTKPISDILSKIRLTLKMSSTVHDWTKDELGGSREMTRTRALSYLLLYPHIRPVRYFCLAILAILGDGVKCMSRYERRFPGVDFGDCPTIMTALRSLYGIMTLNDMTYRDYKEDARDMRILKQNVRSTNDYCEITMKSIASDLFNWMYDYEVKHLPALSYDKRLTSYYVRWEEVNQTAIMQSQVVKSVS
nr:MAG: polyprotein [Chalinolobus tuberculatus flavivirus 1]